MSFCTFVLDLAVGRSGGSREARRYAIMLLRDKDRVQMSGSLVSAAKREA